MVDLVQLVAVLGGLLGLGALWITYVCLFKTTVSHFYPSKMDIFNIYIKLIVSPLYKDWAWTKKVKPGLKISSDVVFSLPLNIDIQNVKDYTKVLELKWDNPEDEMPPPYGCAIYLYPSVCLIAPRSYLFPVFGQVHVRNFWRCLKPIDPKVEIKALLKVREDVRLVKRGVEVDFDQVFVDKDGKQPWLSTTTVLVQCKHKHHQETTRKGPPLNAVQELEQAGVKVEVVKEGLWVAKAGIGLTYAAVVSDYNPIHLYDWTAKMFGFKKTIAHGMYFAAKGFHEAFEAFRAAGKNYPFESDVKFRKPVFLPSRAAYKIYKANDPKVGVKLFYILTNPDRDNELLLEGAIWAYKP